MGSVAELTGVTYISIDQQLWVKTFMPGPFISHVCVWVGIKLGDYSGPHYLVTCENPSSSSSYSSLCTWHPFWWSITGHRDAWASKLLQTFWSVAHINANVLVLILWWPSFSLCYPFPESLLPNFLALPMCYCQVFWPWSLDWKFGCVTSQRLNYMEIWILLYWPSRFWEQWLLAQAFCY